MVSHLHNHDKNLSIVLEKLSKGSSELDLNNCNILNRLDELADRISKETNTLSNITSINLTNNRLGSRSNKSKSNENIHKIGNFWHIFSEKLTTLNLSGNSLNNLPLDVLLQLFKHLPPQLTSLDLSNNDLFKLSGDELVKIFAALPRGLTSLNVSANDLGFFKSVEEMKRIFAAMPEALCSLDLSRSRLALIGITGFNNLNNLEKLKKIDQGMLFCETLSCIPSKVQTLKFCDNDFEYHDISSSTPKSIKNRTEYLTTIFNGVPEHVATISINNEHIARKNTKELIILLAFGFYKHLKSIQKIQDKYALKGKSKNTLQDETYNTAKKLCTFLSTLQREFINQEEPLEQKKNKFVLACLEAINDSRAALEQHRGWKQVLADLVSGLLSICSLGFANYVTGRGMFCLFPTRTKSKKILDNFQYSLISIPSPT